MSSGVSLTVGEDLVTPVIEAKIQAAIVEALGGQGAVIERLVAETLERKVPKGDYGYKQWTLLEKICHETLTKAVEAAVQEWAKSHVEKIKAECLKQITSKKGMSSLVEQMLSGLANVASSHWRLTVSLPER